MGKKSGQHFKDEPQKLVHVQYMLHVQYTPGGILRLLKKILDPLEAGLKEQKIFGYDGLSDKEVRSRYHVLSRQYYPLGNYQWMIAQLRGILALEPSQPTLCYGDVAELIEGGRFVLNMLEEAEIASAFAERTQSKKHAGGGKGHRFSRLITRHLRRPAPKAIASGRKG
jgi:hypothetical protein